MVKVAPTGPIIKKIGHGVTLTPAGQTTHPPIDPFLRITNHSLYSRGAGLVFSTLYLLAQFFVRGFHYAVQAGLELAVQSSHVASNSCFSCLPAAGMTGATTIPRPYLEQTKNTNSSNFKWLCSRTSLREET